MLFFFFFQAEDGIRDLTVTGVQTCALPISLGAGRSIGGSARTGGELVDQRRDSHHQLRRERLLAGGERRMKGALAATQPLVLRDEQGATSFGQPDADAAAVVDRRGAPDEATPLERVEDPGRRRGGDSGGGGQLPHPGRLTVEQWLEQPVLGERDPARLPGARAPRSPDRLGERVERGEEPLDV